MSQATEGYAPVPRLSDGNKGPFPAAEQVLQPGTDYRAVIDTDRGSMVLDLEQDRTPRTVNNFVFLSLHGYYDGVPFHRVLEDFMAQTGDPTGTGTGSPGYTFNDEFHPDLRHRGAGVLSMANGGPGTNGSQFFITFVDTPWLDGKHSVFGRVVEGADVLDKITRIDPMRPRAGLEPDRIRSVTVLAKPS